jgi:hypothetical protein
MVEVIRCNCQTGRVRRRPFTTWQAAADYARRIEAAIVRRGYSLRGTRIELHHAGREPFPTSPS